ncbi:MAG: class E sortase [Gaiellales bacterium]
MASTTVTEPAPSAPAGRARRILRRLSTALIGLGLAVIVYAGVIFFWGDPITWLWAHYEQRGLSTELNRETQVFEHRTAPPPDNRAALAQVRRDAHTFASSLQNSHAFGRLVIGRIGLSVVVVQGTDWSSDLSKGPGHYANTPFPGRGGTVGIAGHRTTFGAWFRNIDSIRNGDAIDLTMPYGTFHYRVQMHRIVLANDWSIIRPQGYERLILSACHPIYSASHRYVIFARGISVTLRGGRTVPLP